MTINEIQNEIIEEFAVFDNKNDVYDYIIELGKSLQPFPDLHRIEDNLIKGCQSKVWIFPTVNQGKLVFYGDSDSSLVKGLVALVLRVVSDQNAQVIAHADLFFMDKIGLKSLLSMNRANGLASMVKQIKLYAIALNSEV
jgi:cysteine desulfuration protein SufE